MFTSRLEYPNGHCLSEIIFENSTAVLSSGDMVLHLRFKPSRFFDYNCKSLVAIHNCYGDAEINEVKFSDIICPTFFRVSGSIPEFKVLLTSSKIRMIENNRNYGNIEIKLNLEILFSIGTEKEGFYSRDKLLDNRLILFAEIPKSDWLDKHLRTWKYFENNETILQINNIIKYDDITKIIAKCRRHYAESRYEDVLREGYTLLETVPQKLGFKDVKSMFIYLNNKDNEYMKDKYTNLDKLYGSIKGFSNLSRHGKIDLSTIVQGHINKNDASFFLNTIEVLIDYLLGDLA